MKKLIFLISFLILSCKTTTKYLDVNIIKYKAFDIYKYDWYDHIEPRHGYMMYTKKTIMGIETNYIHGTFIKMNYKEYMEE